MKFVTKKEYEGIIFAGKQALKDNMVTTSNDIVIRYVEKDGEIYFEDRGFSYGLVVVNGKSYDLGEANV